MHYKTVVEFVESVKMDSRKTQLISEHLIEPQAIKYIIGYMPHTLLQTLKFDTSINSKYDLVLINEISRYQHNSSGHNFFFNDHKKILEFYQQRKI